MKSTRFFVSLVVMALLAACAPATPAEPTPDVNAIRTSAAYTVVAEITLTSAAFTPTVPPLPTETFTPEPIPPTETSVFTSDPTQAALGTPAELCDNSAYVADINIPDGTPMTANQEFVKTWKIKNTGTCTWGDGYSVVFSSTGVKMDGKAVALGVVVSPGQEVEVSVNFKAPSKIGEYVSTWVMSNPQGYTFGQPFYLKIVVQ
jgi:hypothetical protein